MSTAISCEHSISSAPVIQTGCGGSIPTCSLQKHAYRVRPCPLADARRMVEDHHYSRGGSNTAVYVHGLYETETGRLVGVAWWLPPTRVCCESVNKAEWKRVLSLTRLVCLPDAPKNSESFLIAQSVRLIRKDGRFVTLVTYADESQGHTGAIYRACGWTYVGRTGPYPRWISADGRQVSTKATKTRTRAEMEQLGHRVVGKYHKHKFVLHIK